MKMIFCTLIITVLLMSGSTIYNTPLSVQTENIELSIYDYAYMGELETGVPSKLILALGYHVEAWHDLGHAPVKCKNGTYDLGPGLNSRWIPWFEQRFNNGKKIIPSSPESLLIVARILEWNYETLGDWDMAITAYRWGISGARSRGIDKIYTARVREYEYRRGH